jgi:tetratricopeptide (TPR) repeat protein
VRRGVAVAAGLLSLIALPTFMSERLTLDAAEGWRTDEEGAYSALATAADLNPFADAPLLVEAQIARESGDTPRALAALEEAEQREPDDWQSYYLGAKALQADDPEAALAELDQAEALNPTSEDIAALRETLERRTQDDG